jgi:hypothetical protein
MKRYTVGITIPQQDLEVDVLALSMGEARRIALRDVRPLELAVTSCVDAELNSF